jgi:segregation and condensation protein B
MTDTGETMDGEDMAEEERRVAGKSEATMADPHQQLRLLEALLFAVAEPLDEAAIAERLPSGADIPVLMGELSALYANRGVHIVKVGSSWAIRTAPDLAPYLRIEKSVSRALSPAAVETLAVIAYHQPVTRAEIEEVRGKSLSRGTLDVLLQAGWIRPRGRRQTPGRPVTWGTTPAFLDHFGLGSLEDLPGVEELKAAGLLDTRPAIAAYGAVVRGEEQGRGEQAEEEGEGDEPVGEEAEDAAAWDDPEIGPGPEGASEEDTGDEGSLDEGSRDAGEESAEAGEDGDAARRRENG